MPQQTPEETLDMFEHSVESAVFRFSLYLSVFLSILAIIIILVTLPPVELFVERLRVLVLPWLMLFALVSIGRELWMSRVFMEHIHFGQQLEKFIQGKPIKGKKGRKK